MMRFQEDEEELQGYRTGAKAKEFEKRIQTYNLTEFIFCLFGFISFFLPFVELDYKRMTGISGFKLLSYILPSNNFWASGLLLFIPLLGFILGMVISIFLVLRPLFNLTKLKRNPSSVILYVLGYIIEILIPFFSLTIADVNADLASLGVGVISCVFASIGKSVFEILSLQTRFKALKDYYSYVQKNLEYGSSVHSNCDEKEANPIENNNISLNANSSTNRANLSQNELNNEYEIIFYNLDQYGNHNYTKKSICGDYSDAILFSNAFLENNPEFSLYKIEARTK